MVINAGKKAGLKSIQLYFAEWKTILSLLIPKKGHRKKLKLKTVAYENNEKNRTVFTVNASGPENAELTFLT